MWCARRAELPGHRQAGPVVPEPLPSLQVVEVIGGGGAGGTLGGLVQSGALAGQVPR